MDDFFDLQNGSDIRGVAIEGYQDEKVNLTPETAAAIAYGFVQWLRVKTRIGKPFICIGRDSRLSGEMLAEGIVRGLKGAGATVADFGLATTPSMFVCTKPEMLNADGAIMITASHLPYNRNGMKFFTKAGGTDKSAIFEILNFAENFSSNTDVDTSVQKNDFMSRYADFLVSYIRKKTAQKSPLCGSKIIVDAGNGAGGFFVEKVLTTLGADTKGSVFLKPDGRFPNHVPNPENREVMQNFCKTVVKENADLGIMFDTDVDRAALVGENAMPIARNRLIALMSDIVLSESPNATIVTDSVTSTSLKQYIERRGGVQYRFRRGYNNVIKEAIRLNEDGTNCPLAIETSGHCALRENDFLDDGAFLVVKALIRYIQLKQDGKKIDDLLADYTDPAESAEWRVKLPADSFRETGERILREFEPFARAADGWTIETPNYEGVRVNCAKHAGNGWLLMRMSLHEPVLPINLESDTVGGVAVMKEKIRTFLMQYNLNL
jgi:phosphomannomutase